MNGKKSGGRIRRRAHSSSSNTSDEDSDQGCNSTTKQRKFNNTQRLLPQSQNSVPKIMRAELNEDDKMRLISDAVFYVLVQEQKRAVHKKGEILKVSP